MAYEQSSTTTRYHNECQLEIQFPDETRVVRCSWTIVKDTTLDPKTNFRAVDVIVRREGPAIRHMAKDSEFKLIIRTDSSKNEIKDDQLRHPAIYFFVKSIRALLNESGQTAAAVKLLLPTHGGYIPFSDFFEARMINCNSIRDAAGFFSPLQQLEAQSLPTTPTNLIDILTRASAGLLILAETTDNVVAKAKELNYELNNRLSLPWLSSGQILPKKLAFIEGGFNLDFRERVLSNAVHLGIEVYILDRPGHWLQGSTYAHLRSGFIPIDLTLDPDLPKRIVETIRQSGIAFDGITSFSDNYLIPTSQAAEMLGFPTSPSAALSKVVDKFECRLATKEAQCFCFIDMDDLHVQLQETHQTLPCPLIVKPVRGGGSQGVAKLTDLDELPAAVEKLKSQFKQKILLEPYVDAPEIDANFVLHEGEVLFCEISDNLPCAGDEKGDGSFLETGIVFPSALPDEEQRIIRESLHQKLLDLGFRTGIFHVEGRLRDSSMVYAVGDDGVLDLQPHGKATERQPSVFLLEVNARAPGRQALCGVARTYGVDYYTMQLLFAVNSTALARALSHPFLSGAQFVCNAVYLPATKGGVFDSDDVFEGLAERRPDLATQVAEHHCLFKRGDVVPGPETGKLRWIGTFLVCSKDRKEALRLGEDIKGTLTYALKRGGITEKS